HTRSVYTSRRRLKWPRITPITRMDGQKWPAKQRLLQSVRVIRGHFSSLGAERKEPAAPEAAGSSSLNLRVGYSPAAAGLGLTRGHELLEYADELLHFVVGSNGNAHPVVHRWELASNEHALFSKLLAEGRDVGLHVDHEEIRIGRNRLVTMRMQFTDCPFTQ